MIVIVRKNMGFSQTIMLKWFCTLFVFFLLAISGQSNAADGTKHTLNFSSLEKAWLKNLQMEKAVQL